MMDQMLEANAGTPESGFDVVATLASEFLGLDAVCVAEFTGPTLTIRSVAGRSDAYDLRVGRALRLVASDPEVVATLLRKSVVARGRPRRWATRDPVRGEGGVRRQLRVGTVADVRRLALWRAGRDRRATPTPRLVKGAAASSKCWRGSSAR